MKMKVHANDELGVVEVYGLFGNHAYKYSTFGLHDMAMLHKLNVYYIENIYVASHEGIELNPFHNGLYVFIGYEHDQINFVSIDDGNLYTLPAAMHGLRFYSNPNLNLIAREQKYFEMFQNQIKTPAAGFSDYTWMRKCALSFKPTEI